MFHGDGTDADDGLCPAELRKVTSKEVFPHFYVFVNGDHRERGRRSLYGFSQGSTALVAL